MFGSICSHCRYMGPFAVIVDIWGHLQSLSIYGIIFDIWDHFTVMVDIWYHPSSTVSIVSVTILSIYVTDNKAIYWVQLQRASHSNVRISTWHEEQKIKLMRGQWNSLCSNSLFLSLFLSPLSPLSPSISKLNIRGHIPDCLSLSPPLSSFSLSLSLEVKHPQTSSRLIFAI